MSVNTGESPMLVHCNSVEGYTPQIGRYVAQMAEVRQRLYEQLEGLTIAQLNWHPDEETESIGTQLLHINAVEWSWIWEDIFGRPDSEYPGDWSEAMPIRAGVAQVTGRPVAFYTEMLAATRERTLEVLRGFADEDLSRQVAEGIRPEGQPLTENYTIDWIIWHIIQHESAHVGQIELLRRLAPKEVAAEEKARR